MMRIGNGYDVHRLAAGRKLILGGVEIPYELGLDGHSDADVLLHAIIDAMLGAAALGDIGAHFPDTDPRYRGISSLVLLQNAAESVHAKGYTIVNIDSVIVAQRPKLRPYIDEMREKIAGVLSISADCVSIKGKTEEGLGFTGSLQGISAHAVCLLEKQAEIL